MEFETELFTYADGSSPAKEFLVDLKSNQTILYDLVIAGILKLRHSDYHRSNLVKSLGKGLFEMRVGGSNIARLFFIIMPNRKILLLNGIVKKDQKLPKNAIEFAKKLQKLASGV